MEGQATQSARATICVIDPMHCIVRIPVTQYQVLEKSTHSGPNLLENDISESKLSWYIYNEVLKELLIPHYFE